MAIALIDRSRKGGWLFWLNLGLSLAVHLPILLYLLSQNAAPPGAVMTPTAAISINLETTDVLDTVEESAAEQAAAASSTPGRENVPDTEAKPEKTEPSADAPKETTSEEPDIRAETTPEPEDAERLAEEALERAMKAEAERRKAERLAAEQARRARRKQREEKRKQEARREQVARGDAGASGSRSARSSRGRVSASKGAIRNYAAMVRVRIARNKPPSRGARGRVSIAFSLSTSGRLLSARIVASSGDRSLDQGALTAIRRAAPFPAPPSGASARQLRFTIPFQFR